MMRAERGEEAAMLMSAYQQAAQRDAANMRQRRRAIRTLFGVVGAAALVVGCIAAVDVFALNGGSGVDTMTLDVTTGDGDDGAIAMESQFGWSSIGYGWCSIKSSTWCMFSKDKEKCKDNINCYKNRSKAGTDTGNGSGSGDFGNVTVGDSSSEAEVGSHIEAPDDESPAENPEEEAPSESSKSEAASETASKKEEPTEAAPAANPTEPLDLPSSDGGESSKEEPEMGGED